MKKIITLLAIVFCLNTNAQFTKLLDFAGTTNGNNPRGNLISDGTFLYGMTNNGGTSANCGSGCGVVFKIMPNGTGYVKLLDFTCTGNGNQPFGSLFYDGTYLYGMTQMGGTNGAGAIFKIMPNGTGYDTLLNFNYTNGGFPYGSLISDGTFLYGMASYGGTNSDGVIFKIMPNGTGYSTILNFNNTNGNSPIGSLIYDGTFLYGMTIQGGANSVGTIFKIMPNGTGYSNLYDFPSIGSGNQPRGSLIYDGTYLYGMTQQGGLNGAGTIFKIMPNGTGYTNLFDFGGTVNGQYPYGDLISDGTFLYGMTSGGGANGIGLIFKIKPDGTGFINMLDLTATTGASPYSSLFLNNSCLYGMTSAGGTNNAGTIFKFCGVTDIKQVSVTNQLITVYPNPTNDQFIIETNAINKQTLDLFDTNGRLVLSQNLNDKTSINVSTLSEGIYTLTLKSSDRIITKKLVILR